MCVEIKARVNLPTAIFKEVASKGSIGVKSAETTVKGCPSIPTWTQLLMPMFTRRSRWVFPGVKVVTAYWPPKVDVMDPFTRRLSAVGGPLAWRVAWLTVKVVA